MVLSPLGGWGPADPSAAGTADQPWPPALHSAGCGTPGNAGRSSGSSSGTSGDNSQSRWSEEEVMYN